MQIKSIDQVKGLKGKRVLLRLDLNVPVAKGKVADDFRIQSAIPTISLLRDAGAKIIILSHIEGKAGVKSKTESSLKPVAEYFAEKRIPIKFIPKYFSASGDKILSAMKDGEIVMFENLRVNKGEKLNDKKFAEKLAKMGDVYVNEAFPVSHRAHASIVGIPEFLPSYAGPLFLREIKNLSLAFSPEKPFLFILGGAKFETKTPLIEKFLKQADFIYVGGALANNFFQELGFNVGKSVVSKGDFKLPELLKTRKVFIPTDVVSTDGKKNPKTKAVNRFTRHAHEVKSEEMIWDIGPESLVQIEAFVKQAKFVLWNGPVGNYEEGFATGTEKIAEIISKSKATSIVGGADTVAAIRALDLTGKFTFVSTGGGAMLDFLVNETLSGVEALKGGK